MRRDNAAMNLCSSCRYRVSTPEGPKCGAGAPAGRLLEQRQEVRQCAEYRRTDGKVLIQEGRPRG